MNSNKDLSTIGRYLVLLQNSIELCKKNPSKENVQTYKKYYMLYCTEYKNLFGCDPDTSKLEKFDMDLDEERL